MNSLTKLERLSTSVTVRGGTTIEGKLFVNKQKETEIELQETAFCFCSVTNRTNLFIVETKLQSALV